MAERKLTIPADQVPAVRTRAIGYFAAEGDAQSRIWKRADEDPVEAAAVARRRHSEMGAVLDLVDRLGWGAADPETDVEVTMDEVVLRAVLSECLEFSGEDMGAAVTPPVELGKVRGLMADFEWLVSTLSKIGPDENAVVS